MNNTLDGSTRLYAIAGDPIAQVKSPGGITAELQKRGANALLFPAHVLPSDLTTWFTGMSAMKNLDGIVLTIPHKNASVTYCKTLTPRAAFLQTVNTLKRNPDGTWHGDAIDGSGHVEAQKRNGFVHSGKRALQIGAGGAGAAIAFALVEAGVAELAIHDADPSRLEALTTRLASLGKAKISIGSTDPTGFDVIVNATPMGMQPNDPLPFDASKLMSNQFVSDVVTLPEHSALVQAAQDKGCSTVTGNEMFYCVRDLVVDFLLS
jgi:shikimate dehydrogenase